MNADALYQRIEISRPERVTPIMFEHTLVERAKSKRRHIVLPEGTEDRILRAAEILLLREVADLTLLGPDPGNRAKGEFFGSFPQGSRLSGPG